MVRWELGQSAHDPARSLALQELGEGGFARLHPEHEIRWLAPFQPRLDQISPDWLSIEATA
jgi:hypothetical protein